MEAYIGMIMAFGGNYAPVDWLICDGRQVKITDYELLYTLIGTTFGGDGINYFNLPNLLDKVIVGAGSGSGLTPRNIGDMGGTNDVTLNVNNLPAHSHMIAVSDANGTLTTPSINCTLSAINNTTNNFYDSFTDSSNPPNLQALNNASIQSVGGGTSHQNRQPYQKINYIICYNGNYPDFDDN